ncbi:Spo0E family sporulation regulatory protein-aspartic acid phosphatase [Orenia metallireducens]|uniref:Spo0E family sporulation regulatory protein-aspartic acid phosphatase n=1 Tax=Orenia metallireducens TaxID=1413210 RepID=UPI0011466485|nr:Spo0E family sporulation regulatory protein-aspartic acid phosphatase [Orenia metallireducens]
MVSVNDNGIKKVDRLRRELIKKVEDKSNNLLDEDVLSRSQKIYKEILKFMLK